jgi:hypothetical protein
MVASALRRAEPIEARFLLVVQRLVEFLDDGPHGVHRRGHRIEPLAHGLDPACRCARHRRRTRRPDDVERTRRGIPESRRGWRAGCRRDQSKPHPLRLSQ